MTAALNFTAPAQAVRAMVDAGAVFTLRHRNDSFGISFTYSVGDGGDLERCRAILTHVKSRPAPLFEAFRASIQEHAVKDVLTSLTSLRSEEGVQTPSTASTRMVGGAGARSTSTDAEGDVETSPSDAGRGAA